MHLFSFPALSPQAEGTGIRNVYVQWMLFCPEAAHSRAGFPVAQAKGKDKYKQRRMFWWLWWRKSALVQTTVWGMVWEGKRRKSLRWLENNIWQDHGWSRYKILDLRQRKTMVQFQDESDHPWREIQRGGEVRIHHPPSLLLEEKPRKRKIY